MRESLLNGFKVMDARLSEHLLNKNCDYQPNYTLIGNNSIIITLEHILWSTKFYCVILSVLLPSSILLFVKWQKHHNSNYYNHKTMSCLYKQKYSQLYMIHTYVHTQKQE